MNKDYINKIKKENGWFWDTENTYYICISDDCDSVLSYLLAKKYRPNWQLNFYYDFQKGLYAKDTSINITDDNVICLDLSCPIPGMKAIGNHVTKVYSNDPINLNEINLNYVNNNVHSGNYFEKYNLGTLPLIFSMLELKITSNSMAALLMAVDSGFIAHYQPKQYRDSHVQKKYLLDILELSECYELMQKHEKSKFFRFQDYLNLKSKLYVNENGKLEFADDVKLDKICEYLDLNYESSMQELEGSFLLQEKHESKSGYTWQRYDDRNKYFSFVLSRKNLVKMSKKV